MQIVLILFFASLVGIAGMIGNKIVLIRKGHVGTGEDFSPRIPDFQEIKDVSAHHARKYGYVALVETIRVYVQSIHLVKRKSKEFKDKTGDMIRKYIPAKEKSDQPKEASKFLKTMSDYKTKIKKIKHKVKQEEGIK